LEDQEDLEQYCYYVAGTVGLMLTSIFSDNSEKISPEIKGKLEGRSVAFGLGLQITNIAKDFFADRSRGWCYVPRVFFVDEGIDPVSDAWREKPEAFFKVQARIMTLALRYLDEALLYTLDIPRRLFRYRLFCLWPLFMAVETLAKLHRERNLDAQKTVKISRQDVRRIVRNTSLSVLSNSALKSLYGRVRPATA
jgi:farnesyl-diphosphate farnesyltransferase